MAEPTHEVEINFFYLHFRDAEIFLKLASEEKSKLKSFYARHTILSSVFAAEALINRLMSQTKLPYKTSETIDRMGTVEKWSLIPYLLTGKPESRDWFDGSRKPFQSFVELIKIRHWLVHPKSGRFVEAFLDESSSITLSESSKDVPWVETLQGKKWEQTKIPVNPFEIDESHAEKALKAVKEMIALLEKIIIAPINRDWLWEIDLKAKNSGRIDKVTIDSLWGGYTP